MGRAHDLFRIGALAVITKPAGKAIGILALRPALGADLILPGLAGTFPMNAGFLLRHVRAPLLRWLPKPAWEHRQISLVVGHGRVGDC